MRQPKGHCSGDIDEAGPLLAAGLKTSSRFCRLPGSAWARPRGVRLRFSAKGRRTGARQRCRPGLRFLPRAAALRREQRPGAGSRPKANLIFSWRKTTRSTRSFFTQILRRNSACATRLPTMAAPPSICGKCIVRQGWCWYGRVDPGDERPFTQANPQAIREAEARDSSLSAIRPAHAASPAHAPYRSTGSAAWRRRNG